MRNSLAPRVQVELYRRGSGVPSVLGTDYVVTIDGRWGQDRAVAYVEEYVQAHTLTERTGLEWRRSVYRLGRRDSVTI
jgi:hypothetical protein